jgi:GT2 family glycosyltransferase
VTLAAPEQDAGARIDVAIVAYERKALVFETLPLLLASPLIRRVIVVDNASSDGLAREGPVLFPQALWIALARNEGCTAWNHAASQAQAPYLLILDDDCVPDLASLAAAQAHMEREPDVGLAVFNVINAATGASEWAPFDDLDGSRGWANAIGACMLARLDAFRAAGGYKDFFLCFNDLDLVLSLWEAGSRVVYDASWRALHNKQGVAKRRLYFEMRNFTATVLGHLAWLPGLAVIANFALRALFDVHARADLRDLARGLRHGCAMGLRQRRGRRGRIPGHVLTLFYANFLLGRRWADRARLPRAIRR